MSFSSRMRDMRERESSNGAHLDKLVPVDPAAQNSSLETGRPGELGHERQQARQPRGLFAHVLKPRAALVTASTAAGRERRLEALEQQGEQGIEREGAHERGVGRVERVRGLVQQGPQRRRDRRATPRRTRRWARRRKVVRGRGSGRPCG